MNKRIILRVYKIKLSLFFSLFILFVLLLSEAWFLFYQFNKYEENIKSKLEGDFVVVDTIIKNRTSYLELLKWNDTTLWKLIKKSLNNVIFVAWDKIIYESENFNKWKGDFLISLKEWFSKDWYDRYYKRNIDETLSVVIVRSIDFSSIQFFQQINFYLFLNFFVFIFSLLISYLFLRIILRKLEENLDWLSHFVDDLNHEIKTPLSIIVWNLSLLKQKYKKTDETEINESMEASKNIVSSLEVLSELVSLQSSMEYEKSLVSLYDVIQNVVSIFSREIEQKKLTINMVISKNCKLYINEKHLITLFSNLLKNAINYSYVWWKIDIIVSKRYLKVIDFWEGMDEKVIRNIFAHFYTTWKSGWSGIWLHLVKKITEKNNWKIDVKSKLWEGTEFCIWFN